MKRSTSSFQQVPLLPTDADEMNLQEQEQEEEIIDDAQEPLTPQASPQAVRASDVAAALQATMMKETMRPLESMAMGDSATITRSVSLSSFLVSQ
jgi:hypothetical protein